MKSRRLFLALWPSEKNIRELLYLQSTCLGGGVNISPENFHLTILFLGDISCKSYDHLVIRLRNIHEQSFCVTLDRIGFFGKRALLWVGPAKIPSELKKLYINTRKCAQECGISDLSKQYMPHVSLLKNLKYPILSPDLSSIKWELREFHLVESRPDGDRVSYCILESFLLRNLV